MLAKIKNRFLFFVSIVFGKLFPIKPKRILLWSFSGSQFSCNPASITRYLTEYKPGEFELFWLFNRNVIIPQLPLGVKVVRYGSWRHLIVINTAEFVVSNSRVENIWALWKKKRGQKYIMTYHSGMGIKKVEMDAEIQYPSYLRMAKEDSDRCNLMLSGSRFMTAIMKRAFQYSGEILESGTPRNDIFFHDDCRNDVRRKLNKEYNIPEDCKLILYAPTFRNDGSLNHYVLDWSMLIKHFESKFGVQFYVLIRLHPNMLKANTTAAPLLKGCTFIRDVTLYHDIQELLLISDILITDYSSSMFDMALTLRPVFIYAEDYLTYNRGTYIPLNELPFPGAQSCSGLIKNVDEFNESMYKECLSEYLFSVVGSHEKGVACEAFYRWLNTNTISSKTN